MPPLKNIRACGNEICFTWVHKRYCFGRHFIVGRAARAYYSAARQDFEGRQYHEKIGSRELAYE